jgi:hypothetical protein
MYLHEIGTVSFLPSIEPDRLAATLWAISEHISQVDPSVATDFQVGLASGENPLLASQPSDREKVKDQIRLALTNRHSKVHVLLRGGQAGPSEYWQGILHLSPMAHLRLDRFGRVEAAQDFVSQIASCPMIHIIRDVWNIPLAGTPAVAYILAKMETRSLRPVFEGDFSETGTEAYQALTSILARSQISTMEMPRSRKERAGFAERVDKALGREWIETELSQGISWLGLSARDWLTAK